jgi:hypothetical protein
MCGPPQRKQPPLSVPLPPALTGPVPPNPPFLAVVSWSTKWVYFVLPRLPKFFTCMTCGSTDTSTIDSVASVKSCRTRISWSYNKSHEVIHLNNRVNALDGKHPYANIFAKTSVYLWASPPVTALHVQDPLLIVVLLAKHAVAQPLHAPVHEQSQLLCPVLCVQVLEVATHRTRLTDRHRLRHRRR